jgi:hypothetical protein
VAAKTVSKSDYTPLLRLTALLGLRLGEVLGLQWQDFDKAADEGAGVLHVRRQWLTSGVYGPPKTSKATRSIPLPPGCETEAATGGEREGVRIAALDVIWSRFGKY